MRRVATVLGSSSPSSRRTTDSWEERQAAGAQRMERLRQRDETHPCGCRLTDPNTGWAVPEHVCCACHDLGWVRRELRPGQPGFGQRTECPRCVGARRDDLQEFCRKAGIPPLYRAYAFSDFDPHPDKAAKEAALSYATGPWPPPVPFLVLSSKTPGNGKTMLATLVQMELWRRRDVRSEFWPAADLINRYRAANGDGQETPEHIDALMRGLPLLVMDDLGTEYSTEYASERLYSLVNHRYVNRKATIITTNADGLEPRLASRLSDKRVARVVRLRGPDRRRE